MADDAAPRNDSPENQQSTPIPPSSSATVGNAPGAAPTIAVSTDVQVRDWLLSLAIGGVCSWLLYCFPVYTWRVPDRLADVSPMSPQELQDELAEVERSNLWKNATVRYLLAGLGWGVAGVILFRRQAARRLTAILLALAVGVIGGAAAGAIGLAVRQFINSGGLLPLLNLDGRSLVADGMVQALVTVLVLSPIILLASIAPPAGRVRAPWAPIIAGLLVGFITPLFVGLAFSRINTGRYPQDSIIYIAIWDALIVILTGLFIARATPPTSATTTK
ncbi:MAG: hypothetical protein KatS3mg111_3640 [Pirellulaceae bacterium]|nr:MAG: hypothetical protein KatS3mg111_3640 [Pirellulaceae bacterium]